MAHEAKNTHILYRATYDGKPFPGIIVKYAFNKSKLVLTHSVPEFDLPLLEPACTALLVVGPMSGEKRTLIFFDDLEPNHDVSFFAEDRGMITCEQSFSHKGYKIVKVPE